MTTKQSCVCHKENWGNILEASSLERSEALYCDYGEGFVGNIMELVVLSCKPWPFDNGAVVASGHGSLRWVSSNYLYDALLIKYRCV